MGEMDIKQAEEKDQVYEADSIKVLEGLEDRKSVV